VTRRGRADLPSGPGKLAVKPAGRLPRAACRSVGRAALIASVAASRLKTPAIMDGAPGALPGMALEQLRRRVDEESHEHAVGPGERGRPRPRIVLGKPQRRQGGAYLWVPALVFVQRGEGGFDAFGLARP